MVVHSVREMIQRIHDAGFTEAAAAMRQKKFPCDVVPWDIYFKSGGDMFVEFYYDAGRDTHVGMFWRAPRQLINPPSFQE